jgi:hypothetical protein
VASTVSIRSMSLKITAHRRDVNAPAKMDSFVGAGQALATSDLAAIPSHRDRSRRLRQGFDLRWPPLSQKRFRPELRLESVRGGMNVPAGGLDAILVRSAASPAAAL